jgi:CelD/BcsL family acetyltransferase involved in cellulose biosynthesis
VHRIQSLKLELRAGPDFSTAQCICFSVLSRSVVGCRMKTARALIPQQASDAWRVSLSVIEDLQSLERKWTALEPNASCSFFQSWGWIGSWVGALPIRLRPKLLEVWLGDRVVALALLGNQEIRRHRLISSNAFFIAETGDRCFDCLTVEHNGFLLDSKLSAEALRQGIARLTTSSTRWDELFISAVTSKNVCDYVDSAEYAHLCTFIAQRKPYYYVDCDNVRNSGCDYLSTLSRNTRAQIRRAMRAYEENGPISVVVADSLELAEQYFEKLRDLHQRHWESKDFPGAFGSTFARDFHRRLIRNRFSKAEVQLVSICAGDAAIGYLYNFVFRGVVYNYQSGFCYSEDARLKPGLVSHCCAIQHNIDVGMRTYDFLMGSQRFKQSLASNEDEMLWLVLQRPRLRFRVEQVAAKWREKILAVTGQRRQGGSVTRERSATSLARLATGEQHEE